MRYICNLCKRESNHFDRCPCGGAMVPHCERIGCNEPGYKSVYGMGYLATVCKQHYEEASEQDKQDAVRFLYAEG